ncbi:MAG TPA: hypothetical protein VIA02_04160 [Candidatus Limnocylindria bacterium]|jgi:hypothetical protein
MTPEELLQAEERYRGEIEEPLEDLLRKSTQDSVLPNVMAWLVVVIGGFLVCLLIMLGLGA